MSISAAVMTGKGTGAIATIQLFGDNSKAILEKIFHVRRSDSEVGKPTVEFIVGKIYIGKITDDNQTIDQVAIGCEKPDTFTINCHGNPLIVEQIMRLLKEMGVELLTAEQMLCKTSDDNNTIALEAKLALPKVKTLEGTKIILNQIDSGLSAVAKKWQKAAPEQIFYEAKEILRASEIAKLIIFGCKIVLAGPPNTGKSTLFNLLAGKQKAIVTNIRGTTRDWVSAECKIGPLIVELFDTAGLDETLSDEIDKASQQAAIDIINQADLILLVLDNNQSSGQLIKNISGKKVLTVLNKSDLNIGRAGLAPPNGGVNPTLQDKINISAKNGTGIDQLYKTILHITGIDNFDYDKPVCFTARQEELLIRLTKADSQDNAQTIITELLSARLSV